MDHLTLNPPKEFFTQSKILTMYGTPKECLIIYMQEKKMAATTKKKVNKVVKGLKKASKLHASQAKTLSTLKLSKGGSTVNKAGNYTKPTMRKNLFNSIKAGSKGGNPGQWSARKAQLLASQYKKKGGGYK
tara:strand:- start:144 stop:536 length:393 start_codon:yes stop_codon:yes gene_type:complete